MGSKSKYLIMGILMVLLIGAIFCIYEMQMTNQNMNGNNVMIDNASFKLPENSFVYNPDNIDISTQAGMVHIYKPKQITVDSGIEEYINEFSENFTITQEDFDCKFPCKKTIATNKDYTVCNYWFEFDDGLYVIQVNKNNGEYDKIAKDIINSIS